MHCGSHALIPGECSMCLIARYKVHFVKCLVFKNLSWMHVHWNKMKCSSDLNNNYKQRQLNSRFELRNCWSQNFVEIIYILFPKAKAVLNLASKFSCLCFKTFASNDRWKNVTVLAILVTFWKTKVKCHTFSNQSFSDRPSIQKVIHFPIDSTVLLYNLRPLSCKNDFLK